MQRVMDGVAAEVAPLVLAKGRPQRVACLEWNDPLMGCGHWCAAVPWYLHTVGSRLTNLYPMSSDQDLQSPVWVSFLGVVK